MVQSVIPHYTAVGIYIKRAYLLYTLATKVNGSETIVEFAFCYVGAGVETVYIILLLFAFVLNVFVHTIASLFYYTFI